MAFPDERDRNLIRHAEQVEALATDLCDWLSEFNPARKATDLLPVAESDEFEVLRLRRLAGSLYTSATVPVAAAVYGPSQVGKSLCVGQVLKPHREDYCPIGGDETLGEPAYYKNLSFDNDLIPQCGSNEATALVTRFTTKDRIGASAGLSDRKDRESILLCAVPRGIGDASHNDVAQAAVAHVQGLRPAMVAVADDCYRLVCQRVQISVVLPIEPG